MGVDARIRRSYGIDTRVLLSEPVARGDARFPGKLKGDRGGNIYAPITRTIVSRLVLNYLVRNKLAFGKFPSERTSSSFVKLFNIYRKARFKVDFSSFPLVINYVFLSLFKILLLYEKDYKRV